MTLKKGQETLIRQWRLIQALHTKRRGMTATALAHEIGAGRATIYRDFRLLELAGVPLVCEHVGGEARYKILLENLPALVPTPLQTLALRVARSFLAPLEGTALLRELDLLLSRTKNVSARSSLSFRTGIASSNPNAAREIERAIFAGHRIRIKYRSSKDAESRWRTLDPVSMRFADGHLYLIAWDLERDAWRTFKLARIGWVEELEEKADVHPSLDEEALFKRSVKIWDGEPINVAIRLDADVGWLASEWPLCRDQHCEVDRDGSVIVRACVAGTKEVTRWLLTWGAKAEVLEPQVLREEMKTELSGAFARYEETSHGVLRNRKREAARIVRTVSKKGKNNGRARV